MSGVLGLRKSFKCEYFEDGWLSGERKRPKTITRIVTCSCDKLDQHIDVMNGVGKWEML